MNHESSLDVLWTSIGESIRAASPVTACAVAARVQREVAALMVDSQLPAHVRPLKIAMLRSVTVEPVVPLLAASMALRDFAATVTLGGLGNYVHEMLSKDSFVDSGDFDVCILMLPLDTLVADTDNPNVSLENVEPSLRLFFECLTALTSRFQGLLIVCNFSIGESLLARRFQSHHPASFRYAVDQANRLLAQFAQSHQRVILSDTDYLCRGMGTERFFSRRNMAAVMQPFSVEGFQAICRDWTQSCALYYRGSPKCIAVDCDNTLWGGIVGEDGLHGIRLGETYPGICFQRFQRQLKQLADMGFLLAINSKNNEADVREVFDRHPGMVLKWDDFSAIRVNWSDKASNLASIAEELNLGVDSFVFIDDNSFELELVGGAFPGVTCLRVPDELWNLPSLLPDESGLDRFSVTSEDRRKAEMYSQERQRKSLHQSAPSLEEYLRQLGLRMTIERFVEEKHLERTVQLLQKTNQFNLTTRRHSQSELVDLVRRGAMVYLASLSDRFGDYGRVLLAIVRLDGGQPVLDSFLMSCRAIGRNAEGVFMRFLMEKLHSLDFEMLKACHIPTERNQACASFLPECGFRLTATDPNGLREYEGDLRQMPSTAEDYYQITVIDGES